MSGKKILMLVGDFTEEYEIFVFQQGMEAVGHTVHVVCPDKKSGEILKTSLHDFEGDQTYTEKPGHNFTLNKSFAKADPADYDAVYCAGGRGPEYIRTDKRVQALVRHFHEAGKPIFTICHGVQILVAVDGVVRGKKVAALGACEPEVTLAGGTYIDLSPTEAYVDGTMVSAKGWTALAAFMRECLAVLGTRIVHENVAIQAAPPSKKRAAKAEAAVVAVAAKPVKRRIAPESETGATPSRKTRKREIEAMP
ncbi:protease [Kaistia algarum]|nr:protease [Kaistia algarum]